MDGQDNNPLNVNPATDNNQPTPADAILAEPVDVAPAQPSNNPEPAPNVTTPTVDTSGDTEPNNIIATPGIITSAPVETVTPDAGDIIIGGNSTSQAPSKGRKIAVIAGLVALIVVIIVAVVIMVATRGNRYSAEEVRERWSTYVDYLEHGPEDYQKENNGNFLEKVRAFGISDEEQEAFIEESRELYNGFVAAIEASSYRKNADFIATISSYTTIFNTVLSYINANLASQDIIDVLINDGESSALDSVGQILPSPNNVQAVNSLVEAMRAYYGVKIQLYAFYKENLCLLNGAPDYYCAEFLGDNATLHQLLQQIDRSEEVMFNAYKKVLDELKGYINIVGEQLNAES